MLVSTMVIAVDRQPVMALAVTDKSWTMATITTIMASIMVTAIVVGDVGYAKVIKCGYFCEFTVHSRNSSPIFARCLDIRWMASGVT